MSDIFGEINFGGSDFVDEDPPPSTQRQPGSATLDIEDKMVALFTSAEWTLVATVRDNKGPKELVRSTTTLQSHTQPFVKRWARQTIRSNKDKLRRAGVDVDAAYLGWGGVLADLED